MPLRARRLIALAACLLAAATLVGAFGAHVLRGHLAPDRLEILQTAVHYQFFHSLGLLALGVLAISHDSRALHVAGALLGAGIVLFSGSLYLLVAGAPPVLGLITPIGGLCLIAAWLLLARLALRARPAGGQ